VAGGIDFLVRIAEKIIRKNPKQVTIVAPLVTYGFTFAAGTGHIALAGGVVTSGCPMGLPLTNSAIARRSAVVRRTAMLIIGPVSMAAKTRSADMERSASRLGARSFPPL